MPTIPTLIARAAIITLLGAGAFTGACMVVHSWRDAHRVGLERLNLYRFAQQLNKTARRAGGR